MQVEALDVLAELSLAQAPDQAERLQRIKDLTNQAMAGQLSFKQALAQRVSLLPLHRQHIAAAIELLRDRVSSSIVANRAFFQKFSGRVLIVSSGFREIIEPIVAPFGIGPQHVYANQFVYDTDGRVLGVDPANPLAGDKGKVLLLQALNLQGKVWVLGDGYTDYEIREAGLAHTFYAYTENIKRANVVQLADHVAPTFDEFLFHNKLPMNISYPKNRINVLLLENVHQHAHQVFGNEGYNVTYINSALDEDELCEKVKGVHILGIRSKTQITARVLEHADRLIAIGAYCIGVNQIDLQACLQRGVVVFNAPYSNTRSVVELALGEMIVLMRQVYQKSNQMHQGNWQKTSTNCFEIRGKKLGIVGYGNIGTQLSVIAESLGMQVYYYDIIDKLALGNARKCNSLKELLGLCDVVTLHVDGRKENTAMMGAQQFEWMKDKAVLLNLSRGHVVDIEALVTNLKNGKLLGAGLDVFPQEPKNNTDPFVSELMGLPNVILTPHVGGSTEEAQFNIASFVPDKIIDYINSGNTWLSVNFPNLTLPEFSRAHRLLHIHRNTPGILAKINNILASHNVNILGQYLKTNEVIGYVITDIDKEYDKAIIEELKQIEHTIKFRVLY